MSKTYDSVLEMVRDFGREDVAEMLEFAERLRELSQNDWKDIAEAVSVMVATDPPENLMDAAAEERFAATNVIAGIMLDAEAEEITKQFQKPTGSMGW